MSTTSILQHLTGLLAAEMPQADFQLRPGDYGEELVFRSPSEQVGELVVNDDGDELTVSIGTFTHSHWGCNDDSVPAEQHADHIARNVLGFLRDIFSDKVEFYGTGASGGSRYVDSKTRGWVSKVLLGSATYRWSGPVIG